MSRILYLYVTLCRRWGDTERKREREGGRRERERERERGGGGWVEGEGHPIHLAEVERSSFFISDPADSLNGRCGRLTAR